MFKEDQTILLPNPNLLPEKEMGFLELIELRSSCRKYTDEPLDIRELSYLLWCTQGVKLVCETGRTLRNVPSAASLHPLTSLLFIRNVKEILPGLYEFLPLDHALKCVSLGKKLEETVFRAFDEQEMLQQSAVLFLWVADILRGIQTYGRKVYRYVYLDAGHVGQNLYLTAQALALGACAVSSYDEEVLHKALSLDGEEKKIVHTACVGKVERC